MSRELSRVATRPRTEARASVGSLPVVFAATSLAGEDLSGRTRKLLADAFDALMCRVIKHLQVLGAVVVLAAVDVMNQFVRFKVAAEHLFGDESVLADVAGLVRVRVFGLLHKHIPVAVASHAAAPSSVLFQFVRGARDVLGRVLQAAILMSWQKPYWPTRGQFGWTQLRTSDECSASASAFRRDELGSAGHCYIIADFGA